MRSFWFVLLVSACTGCGRSPESSTPTEPGPAAPEATADATAPDPTLDAPAGEPAPETIAAPATSDATELATALDELTQALRRYSAEKRRVPTSLNELVTAGYLQKLPEAPPGQQFAINPARVQVVLVKR